MTTSIKINRTFLFLAFLAIYCLLCKNAFVKIFEGRMFETKKEGFEDQYDVLNRSRGKKSVHLLKHSSYPFEQKQNLDPIAMYNCNLLKYYSKMTEYRGDMRVQPSTTVPCGDWCKVKEPAPNNPPVKKKEGKKGKV